MTRPDDYATNIRIGHEPGRGGERVALAAFLFLVLATAKPWGSTPLADETEDLRPRAAVATAMAGMGDDPCTGRRWLIAVDYRWVDRVVRSWISTDAVIASGPTDPRIRFVTVASAQVLALGYCPAQGDEDGSYSRLTIYRLGSSVAVVTATPVTDAKPERPSENVLFRPAGAAPGGGAPGATQAPPSWDAGRYALRVDGPDGHERWLGLEVQIVE